MTKRVQVMLLAALVQGCDSRMAPAGSAAEGWTAIDRAAEYKAPRQPPRCPDGLALDAAGYCSAWHKSNEAPIASSTATLLHDGRVLVLGPCDYWSICTNRGGPHQQAALYEPKHDQWEIATGSPTVRTRYTATRLLDGRVLVVGGYAGQTALSKAELFDPSTRTWSTVASTAVPRFAHTATLLQNGDVLVFGGYHLSRETTSTAEVFNVTRNAWTAVAPAASTRAEHNAARLGDGRVLVAGGRVEMKMNTQWVREWLNSTEIFDPMTGRWTQAAANVMRGPQAMAALHDGRVLVLGAATSVFDSQAGQWTTMASPAYGRSAPVIVRLANGRILAVGGAVYYELHVAEVFDVIRNVWSVTHTHTGTYLNHTATALADGRVLVLGEGAELYQSTTPE